MNISNDGSFVQKRAHNLKNLFFQLEFCHQLNIYNSILKTLSFIFPPLKNITHIP